MTRFLSARKEIISYVIVLLVGVLLSAMAAKAATTINTSITTGGDLSVTGASTLTGAVSVAGAINASSTIAASGNITVVAGYGLDTAGAGALNLGTTTATSVIIGSSSANVGIASTSPYTALGVTGTTTSSTGVRIGAGGSGITQFLFGTCTVTFGSIVASSTQVSTCTATGVGTGDRIFVTPHITDNGIILVSASSTAANTIQVALFNVGLSGAVNPADNTWSWMAVR